VSILKPGILKNVFSDHTVIQNFRNRIAGDRVIRIWQILGVTVQLILVFFR
jgi:hypothetical protein